MDITKEDFKSIYSTNPHKVCNPRHIKKHYPNIYKEIDAIEADNFKTKLYMYLNDISEVPKCVACGNHVKLKSTGFRMYCSCKCAANSSSTIKAREQTCMERYGVSYISQVSEIKEKTKQTMRERYGVEHALQSKDIYKKFEQTCIERYGVRMPSTLDSIQEKVKATCEERYGGRWNGSELIKEKTQATNIERYGVQCPSQAEEVKEKTKQTCIERHGGVGFGSDTIMQKVKQTLLERYGVEHISHDKATIQKIKQSQLKTYKDKHKFLINRDNHTWVCKCPHPECNVCTEKQYETTCMIYHDRQACSAEQCTILNPIGHNNRCTNVEIAVRNILDELNVQYVTNVWNVITKQELDIYIPSHKIAIECNGSYWHSEEWKDKFYHINKYLKCQEQGITLIMLWEDDVKSHPDACTDLIKYHLGLNEDFPEYFDVDIIDNGVARGEITSVLVEHDGHQCWTGKQKREP